eukprot:jgi/Tetstr1/427620/TSEL_017745.t1
MSMEEPMASPGGNEPRIDDEEVVDAPPQQSDDDEFSALLGEGEEVEEGEEGGELPEATEADDAGPSTKAEGSPEPGEASREQPGRSEMDAGRPGRGETPQVEGPGIKLFLGGLSWDTTEETLREHFGRYGQVIKVEVMRDRHSGTPRGFGFVTYADETAAEEVTQMKHILDGRHIDAKRSVPQGNLAHKPKSRKIFVGGLAPETTDDQFHEYFSQFGEVAEAQIMQDHISGRSRGFGFVTFETESSVEKVFAGGYMHTLAGKQVEVKTATPRGQQGQNQRDSGRGGARGSFGSSPRGRSEPHGPRGGGGGRGGGERAMMAGNMPGVMVPPGMMGAYGMMPPPYGMGAYSGMPFPGPYGAYSGMMMQQMGAYGYPPQGYGGNFGYGVGMAMGYGMPPDQMNSYSGNGAPSGDSSGGADQSGPGSRYHPYSRLSP